MFYCNGLACSGKCNSVTLSFFLHKVHLGLMRLLSIGIILMVYSTIFSLIPDEGHLEELFFLIPTAIGVGTQVLVNILIAIWGFVKKKKSLAKAYILSAGIILIIGFSTCSWVGGLY